MVEFPYLNEAHQDFQLLYFYNISEYKSKDIAIVSGIALLPAFHSSGELTKLTERCDWNY